MKYLEWSQNEVTRMYGPGIGIFYRNVQKDHYVKNIPIKKGSYCTFSPMANHYNPKLYPDPFSFKPERW
jgi:cytochrome P450